MSFAKRFSAFGRFGKACLRQGLPLVGLTVACSGARADERAQQLLQRVQERLRQTQTLSVEFTTRTLFATRYRDTQEKGTILLSRPGRACIEITRFRKPEQADVWKSTGNGSIVAADGGAVLTLIRHPQSVQYRRSPENGAQTERVLDSFEPLRGFFSGVGPAYETAAFAGKKRWENADYDVVTVTETPRKGGARATGTAELYIGDDGLIARYLLHSQGKGQPVTREVVLHHLKRDLPVATTAFELTPPSDALPFERTPPSALLAAGTVAPDFTAEDAAGKAVHLSDLRGKVVLLKFWATWCWSCRQSLPSTNEIAHRYADKDLVVLAVDIWDSKKGFRSWLSHRTGGDAIRFVIDPRPQGKDVATTLYHISATPTQYVIGKDGKIVTVVEGYEGPSEQLEGAIRAAVVSPAGRSASLSGGPARTTRSK